MLLALGLCYKTAFFTFTFAVFLLNLLYCFSFSFFSVVELYKLIKKRRCNFMDRILGDSRYSVLCDAFVSNLCSQFVVI